MRFNIRHTTAACLAMALVSTGVQAQTRTAPQPQVKTAAAPAKPVQAPKPTGVSNQDVIDLVKAGMADELVLTYLGTQQTRAFDLSAKGLVGLKTGGVSDRVISAMLGQPVAPAPTTAVASKPAAVVAEPKPALTHSTADDVVKPRDAGIYALLGGKLVQLEPGVASSAGVSGKSMMGNAATMGFKKVKAKASVSGTRANARVSDSTEFYFYGSGGTFNPNQFVLVRLETGSDSRQIVIGEAGMTGIKQGIPTDDQVRVQITKIDSGIYKVVVERPLTPGEYAFLSLAQLTSPSLWDFGVDR